MTAVIVGDVTRRKGSKNFYYRRALPKAVHGHFGRVEVWRSLFTTDLTEARARAVAVAQHLQAEIDAALGGRPLSRDDIPELAARFYEDQLRKYEARRAKLPTPQETMSAEQAAFSAHELGGRLDALAVVGEAKHFRDWRRLQLSALREAFAAGVPIPVAADAHWQVSQAGMAVDPQSTAFRELCDAFMRAQIEALERTFERDQGDYSRLPRDPLLKQGMDAIAEQAVAGAHGRESDLILDVFDRYAAANPNGIRTQTLVQFREIVRLFAERIGDRARVRDITKANVRAWRDDLLKHWPVKAAQRTELKGKTFPQIIEANKFAKLPVVSVKTVRKYLSALGGFCGWLVSDGYLDAHPVDGLYPRPRGATYVRLPFNTQELQRLVGEIAGLALPNGSRGSRDAQVWAPLIGMFTGARLGEILQLRPQDVVERDGLWCFDITESADDHTNLAPTQLKTKSSRRVVPVHSSLIELGILDVRAAAISQQSARLFSGVRADTAGQLSGNTSRWFGRSMRKLGARKGVTFHSLRHTVADVLRDAGLKDYESAWILGHSDPAAGLATRLYGQGQEGTLKQRKAIVESIAYPEVDLRSLRP